MNNVIKINDNEALDYCKRQENDFFDRKSARIKPAHIQDIAVAFANTEGGMIVVGVEDSDPNNQPFQQWVGKPEIEGYNEIISVLSDLNPGIDFQHKFLYRDGGYENRYVLQLEIRKSLKVHETAKGDVLVRKGAQSLKLKGSKIQDLMRAKGMTSEEDSPLLNIPADPIIEGAHLKEYLNKLPITNKDPIDFCLQEGLISEKGMDPTVASVILFAHNPSSVMPRQCAVKIVRYDSSHEDIERDNLTDDIHSIEGPLYMQIFHSFEKLKEVLSRCECWSFEGIRHANYPDEALYEVLVNSVLHRDYGVSDNVLISVHRNRVEFKSPGRLPGFVTPENILTARFSRNPKLVRLLSRYPDAPNKDLGEGVNTVFERMKQAGFVDPEIKDDGTCVSFILRRAPRGDNAELVLEFIRKNGSIANRQALDILALDTSEQVTQLFTRMKESGKIIKENDKQTGIRVRWVLSK